jgi:Xaa-Pro aminopeptidase
MEDPKERLVTVISTAELERRWKAAREMMRDNKIDYLLMCNDEEYFGGYVRWFTDIPARHSYAFTVIFPIDDEMSTISSSPPAPADPFPKEWAVRGVKRRLGAPYYPSLYYTSTYDAELSVGVLKEKKRATIGLVGGSNFHLAFYEYLAKHLPGSKFVDVTDQIDRIKAIKSPEEIQMIKRTAQLQDSVMEHVRKMIKPGLRDLDIYAEAHYSATRQGMERGQVLIGSYSPGDPHPFQQRHFMNRALQEGDISVILLEGNGPGGFYTEIARVFSLGEPSQELKDVFAYALEAQKVTLNLLKPGANPKDIWDANNEFLQRKGYPPEGRQYAHGEGYELVERPAIRYDEPMKIQASMNIAVHPFVKSKTLWATVCDNYLITETGVSPCLHKTPKEIIVV